MASDGLYKSSALNDERNHATLTLECLSVVEKALAQSERRASTSNPDLLSELERAEAALREALR